MLRICYIILLSIIFNSTYAQITISGKVTGVDDKPLSIAHIFLTYPSDDNPVKSVNVQKDGNYKIIIESNGLWMLHFTGVFHHEYSVAIYSNKTQSIKLNVKLCAYNYHTKFSAPKVIGNFNGWSIYRGIPLKKDKDGTYSTIIESKSDTVIYKLLDVRTGGKVEGTDADGYISTGVDPEGIEGYSSYLIKKKDEVKIVFDPRKLIRSNEPPSIKFIPNDSFVSRFAHAYDLFEYTNQKYKSLLYAHLAKFQMNFKFDFSPYIDSIKVLMKNENDSLITQVLQLDYFGLEYLKTHSHFVDVKTSREILKEIPPGSVIWSLNPIMISKALNLAAYSEPEKDKYVRKVLDLNPMRRIKEIILHSEINRKFHSLQYNDILPYLSILIDQYGDSPEALLDRKIYSKYIKLNEGTEAPKFSIESLYGSKHFTNKSFKGKYLLLNFWAASNPGSVDELQNLKEAYEKYKEEKFAILSVSVDSSASDAINFIKNKIALSWNNVIEKNGLNSKLCKDFEVYSVPKSVLIDPNGKISAAGWDLRGANLFKTLKIHLQK